MDRHESRIHYAHKISPTIPDNVVNFGIDLAISAMALLSCCKREIVGADKVINVGADVGINVGADVGINVGALTMV